MEVKKTMKCSKCNEEMQHVYTESEPFKDSNGVYRFRELKVYRCVNSDCSNNDNIKVPVK